MIKKLIFLSILAAFITSCSNDFDLIDTKKEIPVVYGILSKQDTAHYIRIERAFADENVSAIDLAKNIDSLYYKDIVVQLISLKDNRTFNMVQVDGNKEGYIRKSGNFVSAPNYLYKIKASEISLETNEVYKLLVKRKDGTVITEAQTVIVPSMELIENRTLIGFPLKLSVFTGFSIVWSSQNVENAKMYDAKMLIEFSEKPLDGSPDRTVELVWDIVKSYVPNPNNGQLVIGTNTVAYKVNDGQAFYRFIAQNLENAKPAIRKFQSVRFKIDAGGNELYEYINVGNINTGITGTEVLPTYSNIKNGFGILSSKNFLITDKYLLSERSIDSLNNGSITKKFGFTN
jgi:hypothetical protein